MARDKHPVPDSKPEPEERRQEWRQHHPRKEPRTSVLAGYEDADGQADSDVGDGG